MEDIPNTTSFLKQQFDILNNEWKGHMELRLASENMLDTLFEERLYKDDLLPIGDAGKHLLVETSYYNPPLGLNEIFASIKKKGYGIILAHPERYIYMNEKDYLKMKSQGILFQLNLLSVIGVYGKRVKKKAEWLLNERLIDFTGSDIHRLTHFEEFFGLDCLTQKNVNLLRQIKSFNA